MKTDSLINKLQRLAGERDRIKGQLKKAKREVDRLGKEQEALVRSMEIIQVTAKLTQQELEVHVSELTTLALEAIFPEPYQMELAFTLRRNRSEADLLLVDGNGNKVQPMDAVGGGVVDIAALSLRLSLWSLHLPKLRPLIIMDEPCRFVSRDLQAKAGAMIREVSKRLGIQFLLVTHDEALTQAADRVLVVSKHKGISKVEEQV